MLSRVTLLINTMVLLMYFTLVSGTSRFTHKDDSLFLTDFCVYIAEIIRHRLMWATKLSHDQHFRIHLDPAHCNDAF